MNSRTNARPQGYSLRVASRLTLPEEEEEPSGIMAPYLSSPAISSL